MEHNQLCRMLPSLEVLAEVLPGARMWVQDPECTYRSIQIFRRGKTLDEKTIYLLSDREAAVFPVDSHSYISTGDIPGKGNHIFCPDMEMEEILDRVLGFFAELREQEILIDQLLYQGASLKELCEAGARLLGNPVYLHDDWFIALAMSSQVDAHMRPEHIMSSTRGFVPQAIVDDFKYDNEYLETYIHHTPQIWQGTGPAPRSLYVNLWEGNVYRGRLLVFEVNRPLCKKDFLLAELLAQHGTQLLRKRTPGGEHTRSMDDLVFQLLQGEQPSPADLNQILRSLNWNLGDQFCVIRVQSQQGISSAMDHLLHMDLFRSFPKSYILLRGYQQCLLLNLTRQNMSAGDIRHTLAPVCRDYCLYAGVSVPVEGIGEICYAYIQAGIALNEAFQLRNEKWIIGFSGCAMNYWFDHVSGELKTRHLIAPELSFLVRYDEENGTEYFTTLREYLLQERNIPRTSEKLIIHRTTLLYRLKKIQSLIPLNLDDPETRLYLLLSLQIMKNLHK